MRKLVYLLLGLALLILGIVGFIYPASPASASTASPPIGQRIPPPGAGYYYGASQALLGNTERGCVDAGGGWTINGAPQHSFITGRLVSSAGTIWNPRFITLCDPIKGGSANTWNLGYSYVSLKTEATVDATTAWRVGSMTTVGGGPAVQFVCAMTEWSQPSTWLVRNSAVVVTTGGSTNANGGSGGGYTSASAGANAPTPANCPYIVKITVPIAGANTTWVASDPMNATAIWNADEWYQQRLYNLISPLQAICSDTTNPGTAAMLQCAGIVPLDGSNFAVACAGAPLPSWGDFSWFPNVVGHYAECLFNPMNGFDRTGQAKATWERSQPGQIVNAFNDFTDVVSAPGACGPLVTLPLNPFDGGSNAVVDSCSWTWASGIRTFLGFVVTVLGFIAVALFFVKVWASVFGGPAASPVTNEGDDK